VKLICTHCHETFLVAEDAFLITDEDKYRKLSNADAKVLIIGRSIRKPDMVMHWTRTTTASERDDEQRKAAEIQAAIARGEMRQWWCGKCYNEIPNSYPDK